MPAPTPSGARALEACPEDCWLCEEHDDAQSPCCYAAVIPHREHVCQECKSLLAASPEVVDENTTESASWWVRADPNGGEKTRQHNYTTHARHTQYSRAQSSIV